MEIDQHSEAQLSQSQPIHTTSSPNTMQSDSMQAWIPTKNPASLVSYYAGIFGLLPFIGLPGTITAIVAGIMALKKYKQNPTPGAKVHAIIGLTLGIVQIAVFLFFIASVVLNS